MVDHFQLSQLIFQVVGSTPPAEAKKEANMGSWLMGYAPETGFGSDYFQSLGTVDSTLPGPVYTLCEERTADSFIWPNLHGKVFGRSN